MRLLNIQILIKFVDILLWIASSLLQSLDGAWILKDKSCIATACFIECQDDKELKRSDEGIVAWEDSMVQMPSKSV